MKRLLVLMFVLSIVITSESFGASARWQALGNEHRFIIDTTNYTIYPGRLHQFTNALFVIPLPAFENNNLAAGVLMKINENMTGAFHFNLPSSGASKLGTTLKAYADKNDRLAGLELRPFPDLFWAMKSGSTTIGARVAVAMDSASTSEPAEIKTSAMAADINIGATMAMPYGDLDIGVGAGIASFSDEAGGKVTESTGGYSISLDARLNKPMGKKCTLVPILNAKLGADPTEKDQTEVSYMAGDAGVGLRTMFDKKMVVTGLVIGFNSITKTPPTGTEVKDTTLSPKFVAGCEAPITKWLIARGGANAQLTRKSNNVSSMDVSYYYNMGIRILYGGVIIDAILARDILHRGPYFISGASKEEGSDLSTNICVTYAF